MRKNNKPRKGKKEQKEIPLPMPIGTLIQYYDQGWRVGHFVGMKGTEALVKPIGPKGRDVREITVPLSDIRKASQ